VYAQLIRATVDDGSAVEDQFRRWEHELAPAASGWRDATGGITDDGRLVAVARFDSEDAARRNASRPEQDAWWSRTAELLRDPTFEETTDVRDLWGGPTTDAQFVQMMLAVVADRDVLEEIEDGLDEASREWRPDALGGYRVWLPDGRMLAVDYFTSESEARAGEQSTPPPGVAEAFPRWTAQLSEVEWFDLRRPWITAAGS
jgi:hypothetical protein